MPKPVKRTTFNTVISAPELRFIRMHASGAGFVVIRPGFPDSENTRHKPQTTNTERPHMQSYLFIGGGQDSINVPVADDTDVVQLPKDVTDKDKYLRETLSVGDASITIYRHDSLTSEQVLARIVVYYEAWAVHQSRRRR